MARGWESKSVADQIEQGKSERSETPTAPVSLEERHRLEKLASLQLSKSRLLEQLERATHAAHRGVLLNGLKAIEQEIEDTSKPSS